MSRFVQPSVVRHGIAGPVEVRDGRGRPLRHSDAGQGALRIALRKGDRALITTRGDRPDLTIAPVRPYEEAPRRGLPSD
jgi:alpha-L-fucosidase 2